MSAYDELFDPSDPGNFREHPLSFGCQCKSCTRLSTLSMFDQQFLYSIGVKWSRHAASPVNQKKVRSQTPSR